MKMIVCLLALLMAVIATAEGSGTDDEKSCPQDYPITDNDYGNKARDGSILYTVNFPYIHKVVSAIANTKDRELQKEFDKCIGLQPQQLLDAKKDCFPRFNIDISNGNEPMWDKFAEDPQTSKELVECARQNTKPFVGDEVAKMVEFEACAKKLYTDRFGNTP